MARIRAATNYRCEPLERGWQFAELKPAGDFSPKSPLDIRGLSLEWRDGNCPGTVASALRAQNAWDWSSTRNFDASDWWYRTHFSSAPCAPDERLWLEFDGLATVCDLWLNGVHILRSENMFLEHELDVSELVRQDNELVARFSSLDVASSARRPRPRFKTRLIERQQLRWFRTTLLGRIPGWTPPVTAVGPWRAARLVRRRQLSFRRVELRTRLEQERALVSARLEVDPIGTRITSAVLQVGPVSTALAIDDLTLQGELEVPEARRWWPHGYGEQTRYPARIIVKTEHHSHELELDPLAFRSISVDSTGSRFALIVNQREIRCRGACWTPADVVSLGDDAGTVATVRQAHAAGMNMLRVGGTMIYESDAFYEECDRSGVLVWQDFMFANCDYPGDDEAFRANVKLEAEQFLARTETRACLAVLCGNSEIEQQVAMLGLARDTWKQPLFEHFLRGIAREQRPDVPYVSSTPSGGSLPFQVNSGLSHYYGVGAYQRPLEDARRADVKFTPECLAFANIPEDATIDQVLGNGRAPFHDPRWKARVPRDSGPGWDFDDVRDHYTKLLFGIDPIALRYEDPERALSLGRTASGEVMARTLSEWRRAASNCRGALIWFLRDLWPGAGFGLIDAQGLPKAAYYYVKRAMQAQVVFLSDEGLNGLGVNVINDTPQPLRAELELQLIRNGSLVVASGSMCLEIVAHGAVELDGTAFFEHFVDLTHAYRFGPSQYDVAVATLRDAASAAVIAESYYFPRGLPADRAEDLGLTASVELASGDEWVLRLQSKRFALSVALDLPGFSLGDCYFPLAPGRERCVPLKALVAGAKPAGFVRALNAQSPTRIVVSPARG